MKQASRHLWILAGLMVLALGLRLINIAAEPYWGDEILSLDIVRYFSSMGEMIRYLSEVEFHPPLYYILLWPWIRTFGEMEGSTRALSLIFSVATVPLVYWAGKSFFKRTAPALVASGIVAVLPIMVEYGQEARPYAIEAFFITLALTALWKYVQSNSRKWLAVYAVSTTFAIYLHYSAIFFLGAAMGWWLIEIILKKRGKKEGIVMDALLAHAVIFLLFFPWLSSFFYKLQLGQFEIFGLSRNLPSVRPPAFFEESIHQLLWVTKETFVTKAEIFGQMIFLVSIFLSSMYIFKSTSFKKSSERYPLAFLAWFIIAPVVFFLFSPQSVAYTPLHHRHILFIVVPLALLIAEIITRLDFRKAVALLAVFLITLIPSLSIVLGNDFEWDRNFRYEEAGMYINQLAREGDLVIVSVSTIRTDLTHYLNENIQVESLVPYMHFGNDSWSSRATLGLMENEAQVRLISLNQDINGTFDQSAEKDLIEEKLNRLMRLHEPKRIWLYAFSPSAPAHDWFNQRGWRHGTRQIGGLFRVDMYEAPNASIDIPSVQ